MQLEIRNWLVTRNLSRQQAWRGESRRRVKNRRLRGSEKLAFLGKHRVGIGENRIVLTSEAIRLLAKAGQPVMRA